MQAINIFYIKIRRNNNNNNKLKKKNLKQQQKECTELILIISNKEKNEKQNEKWNDNQAYVVVAWILLKTYHSNEWIFQKLIILISLKLFSIIENAKFF